MFDKEMEQVAAKLGRLRDLGVNGVLVTIEADELLKMAEYMLAQSAEIQRLRDAVEGMQTGQDLTHPRVLS